MKMNYGIDKAHKYNSEIGETEMKTYYVISRSSKKAKITGLYISTSEEDRSRNWKDISWGLWSAITFQLLTWIHLPVQFIKLYSYELGFFLL